MPAYTHIPGSSYLPLPRFAVTFLAVLQALAFWLAVGLVGLYPIALFYPGVATPELVVGLLGVHGLALVLGYSHDPS